MFQALSYTCKVSKNTNNSINFSWSNLILHYIQFGSIVKFYFFVYVCEEYVINISCVKEAVSN